MNISEEQLKELVLRVLRDLEAEKRAECTNHPGQKLYMLCVSPWSEQYMDFLKEMEECGAYDVVPVIPSSWKDMGYEARLRQSSVCGSIRYRSGEKPADLDRAVTLLPVVPRDVLVKTALCISDTYETSWIAECMEQGGRVVLLRSGLARFSGKEKPAYRNRIMEYCRQTLEFGIEICSAEEFSGREPCETPPGEPDRTAAGQAAGSRTIPGRAAGRVTGGGAEKGLREAGTCMAEPKKKRVIASSNVEQLASEGVIYLQPGDIVTDLAKDRAKFLKIVFR